MRRGMEGEREGKREVGVDNKGEEGEDRVIEACEEKERRDEETGEKKNQKSRHPPVAISAARTLCLLLSL